MKKNIKILIIVILIVLIAFLGNTIRKYIIFDKISDALLNLDYSNYYHKEYIEGYESEPYIWRACNGVVVQTASYGTVVYTENEKYILVQKADENAYIKTEKTEEPNLEINYFSAWEKNETFSDKLKLSLKSSIKTEMFDNKECFAIKMGEFTTYIDKETLFTLYMNSENAENVYYETEIGTQKEEDYTIEKLLEGYVKLEDTIVE